MQGCNRCGFHGEGPGEVSACACQVPEFSHDICFAFPPPLDSSLQVLCDREQWKDQRETPVGFGRGAVQHLVDNAAAAGGPFPAEITQQSPRHTLYPK